MPEQCPVEHVNLAGTLLKAGGYRSSAQYLAALKREGLAKGHDWSDSLTLAKKDAVRSCVRGLGPDRQSKVEVLEQGAEKPLQVVIFFSLFACREVVASLRRAQHMSIEEASDGCRKVSLLLPSSKTDPKGDGVLRQLGCSCKTSPGLCPVKANRLLKQRAESKGHNDAGPFFVSPEKGAEQEIHGREFQARGSGYPEDEAQHITGHAFRPFRSAWQD